MLNMSQDSIVKALEILKKATPEEIACYLGINTAAVYRGLNRLRGTKTVVFAGVAPSIDYRKSKYWRLHE